MKVFLDTETMGLSSQYCALLEIAALAIDDDGEIIEQFHEYINPGRPIPYEVTRINHISDKDVANCATEKEVLSNLAEWMIGVGADTVIAHNANFDMRFLRDRSDICYVKNHPFHDLRVIDTLPLARKLVKAGKIKTEPLPDGTGKAGGAKQEQIARALGIEYFAHNALEDAYALSKIYKILKNL